MVFQLVAEQLIDLLLIDNLKPSWHKAVLSVLQLDHPVCASERFGLPLLDGDRVVSLWIEV